MRLIDADKLIHEIRDEYHGGYSEIQLAPYQIINMLEEQPTAYDVDSIVRQIREWTFNADINIGDGTTMNHDLIASKNAIDIVKSGGIE